MKKIKETGGISLVALIITIIVLIILTGAVIMTMNNGDTIGKSKEAVFKHDVSTYREELVSIKMNEQLKRDTGVTNDLKNLTPTNLNETKLLLPSFKDEYDGILQIKEGDLYCNKNLSSDTDYYKWLQDLNILVLQESNTQSEFEVENGVLIGYTGSGGNVVIPNTVTKLTVVLESIPIETLTVPDSVTSSQIFPLSTIATYIVGSESVKTLLMNRCAVPASQITVDPSVN